MDGPAVGGLNSLCDSLAESGVRTDDARKLFRRQPADTGGGKLRDHVSGAFAHELRAQEHVGIGVKHKLDKAALPVFDDGYIYRL